MEPRIIFLGTGGDTTVVGKQIRASGGIVIQIDNYQLHIDPGPGALVRATQYGVNLRENICILCSKNTINHANDVNAVISAMTHNGLDIHGVLICNSELVNGSEKEKPYLTNFHKKCIERIIMVEPNKRIGIENIDIQTLKTKDKEQNTIGFKIITQHFTLSYTSDTGYTKEISEQYKKSDILILNVKLSRGEKSTTDLNVDDAIKIIEKTKPSLAIITHFGKKILEQDTLELARDITRATKTQVIAATDGMIITPTSYSASAKQKTLSLYSIENPNPVKEQKEPEHQEEKNALADRDNNP